MWMHVVCRFLTFFRSVDIFLEDIRFHNELCYTAENGNHARTSVTWNSCYRILFKIRYGAVP